jgi:hypothetical protein
MGLTIYNGTMDGAMTPICNCCGIMLCWDISEEEALGEDNEFWENWICQECNDGVRLSLKDWRISKGLKVEEDLAKVVEEQEAVKADIAYNDFKSSGEIYKYEAARALAEQIKWQEN